jgi:hypothetical protein
MTVPHVIPPKDTDFGNAYYYFKIQIIPRVGGYYWVLLSIRVQVFYIHIYTCLHTLLPETAFCLLNHDWLWFAELHLFSNQNLPLMSVSIPAMSSVHCELSLACHNSVMCNQGFHQNLQHFSKQFPYLLSKKEIPEGKYVTLFYFLNCKIGLRLPRAWLNFRKASSWPLPW